MLRFALACALLLTAAFSPGLAGPADAPEHSPSAYAAAIEDDVQAPAAPADDDDGDDGDAKPADKDDADDSDDADEGDDAKDAESNGSRDEADKEPAEEATSDDDEEESTDEADDDGDEEQPADDANGATPKKGRPETYTVETQDLTIEIEVDGVFVADETDEVALRPEVWSTFKVVRAVAHGARVREGDALVEFDDEDINEAIEERSLQQHIGEVSLRQAEEDFARLEKSIELDYDLAKRAYDQDRDEYKRFQETMRELSEKLADYYLKSAHQELDNAREELEQLQKMYEADDLTEESEEIVLKRQKFQVEVAEFSLEYSQINHDYTMDVAIPQRDLQLKSAVEQSRLAFERAKVRRSLGLSKERYELEAARETRRRSTETHAKLLADRGLMTLRAPRDGYAYYGRCVNGRWMEVGSMASKLIPFVSIAPNTVVLTIVDRLPMHVETAVGEKEFPLLKAGKPAHVAPLADAEVELDAKVESVDVAPGSGNKFTVRLALDDDEELPKWLMPGMTCKTSIVTYEAEDAVVIPADLVQRDKDDEDATYVMLLEDDDEEPVRRDIKLGKTKDKLVEVVRGLKDGDKIAKGATDQELQSDD